MKSFEDAEALFQKEKDPFYLAAFMLQCWLGGLVLRAAAEYAEKKNPQARSLQSGEAWRAFLETFHFAADQGFGYLLFCLLRFSASDDSPQNSLRLAMLPLALEHHFTGDYFGPKTVRTAKLPKEGNELARRTIVRWCDWLDAAIHLRTHRHWHLAPDCFHPDPETRRLAALGNAERYLAKLDARARACWFLDFADAAQRYQDSPKWAVVGKAMAAAPSPAGSALGAGDSSARSWLYPDVDTLVIALWPMVKGYNWTYRDILNTIRPALKRQPAPSSPSALRTPQSALDSSRPLDSALCNPQSALDWAYPCEREQDFATYCRNVLGLRKTTQGVTAKNGQPAGYEIALRLISPQIVNRKS